MLRTAPFSLAQVTNTRPAAITGVDVPGPGIGAFHATFSVADHFVGRSVSSHTPVPCGPRHAGQSAAGASGAAAKQHSTTQVMSRRMALPISLGPVRPS